MGGLAALLEIIVAHEIEEVRVAACGVFSQMNGNNDKIQAFSTRYMAINLTVLLEFESTPNMKEAVLGALSAFVKAGNFAAKRQFVIDFDGVNRMSRWLCTKGEEEKSFYGQGT